MCDSLSHSLPGLGIHASGLCCWTHVHVQGPGPSVANTNAPILAATYVPHSTMGAGPQFSRYISSATVKRLLTCCHIYALCYISCMAASFRHRIIVRRFVTRPWFGCASLFLPDYSIYCTFAALLLLIHRHRLDLVAYSSAFFFLIIFILNPIFSFFTSCLDLLVSPCC